MNIEDISKHYQNTVIKLKKYNRILKKYPNNSNVMKKIVLYERRLSKLNILISRKQNQIDDMMDKLLVHMEEE